MKMEEYFKRLQESFDSGRISAEAYDAAVENADIFCDDDDDSGYLPETYAEIEYDDFDNPEAISGTIWDDMNYLHYMER